MVITAVSVHAMLNTPKWWIMSSSQETNDIVKNRINQPMLLNDNLVDRFQDKVYIYYFMLKGLKKNCAVIETVTHEVCNLEIQDVDQNKLASGKIKLCYHIEVNLWDKKLQLSQSDQGYAKIHSHFLGQGYV